MQAQPQQRRILLHEVCDFHFDFVTQHARSLLWVLWNKTINVGKEGIFMFFDIYLICSSEFFHGFRLKQGFDQANDTRGRDEVGLNVEHSNGVVELQRIGQFVRVPVAQTHID